MGYTIVKISDDHHHRLKMQSAFEKRSMKKIVEDLIDEYLKRKEVNRKEKTAEKDE